MIGQWHGAVLLAMLISLCFTVSCGAESGDDGDEVGADGEPTTAGSTETPEPTAESQPAAAEIPASITAEEIAEGSKSLNGFRSAAQSCGGTEFAAVPALTWNRQLYDAAKRHSDDMATSKSIGHTGSDDSSPFDRIEAAGYSYSGAAENVAGKMSLLASAMDGWIKSSGHCTNMMRPQVTQYGMAVTDGYWTMVLAAPR